MKSISLLLTVVFFFAFEPEVCAQDDQPKTLVGNGKISISGFGGPIIEFSSINGSSAVGAGGGGAALFNKVFYFGGYGLGVSKSNIALNSEIYEVELGHGGFWTGFIIKPNKVVHALVDARLGWGEINETSIGTLIPIKDQVFVAHPQAAVEVNVTLWFKINAGIGYRWVSGQDFTNVDMSGVSGTVGFLFGWFGNY